MFRNSRKGVSALLPVSACAAIVFFMFGAAFTGSSADRLVVSRVAASAMPTPETPVYTGYKGVKVGMPMAEVRTKLGKARDTSDTEDYFVVSEAETVQVLYDNDKTVKIISVNYIGANRSAPAPKAVFGPDTDAKPDGAVFKLVRYPKAGYWVSYNRTAGDNAMVVVTLQKMPPGQ